MLSTAYVSNWIQVVTLIQGWLSASCILSLFLQRNQKQSKLKVNAKEVQNRKRSRKQTISEKCQVETSFGHICNKSMHVLIHTWSVRHHHRRWRIQNWPETLFNILNMTVIKIACLYLPNIINIIFFFWRSVTESYFFDVGAYKKTT